MFSMIRCVMNAKVQGVEASLHLSFVLMSHACSITASTVGHKSILVQEGNFTSLLSKKELIGQEQCHFVGARLLRMWMNITGSN